MFWESGRFSHSTKRKRFLRREGIEGAFKAASDAGKDDTGLAGETLGSAIDDGNDCRRIGVAIFVNIDKAAHGGIQPTSSFNIVKARYDTLKGSIERGGFVLNFSVMSSNLHPRTAFIDESGRNLSLGGSNILQAVRVNETRYLMNKMTRIKHAKRMSSNKHNPVSTYLLTKQKLPIEIGNVNGIKINNVNVSHTRHGQIFQQFTTQSASTNHKDTRSRQGG
mmetsp:Transcript_34142/g.68827  ORF Transcript_34142/g.68827 Transcript_34142/m.68827 type:complete len:222 (-) Transcript_34142:2323-2988(-)